MVAVAVITVRGLKKDTLVVVKWKHKNAWIDKYNSNHHFVWLLINAYIYPKYIHTHTQVINIMLHACPTNTQSHTPRNDNEDEAEYMVSFLFLNINMGIPHKRETEGQKDRECVWEGVEAYMCVYVF